MNQTAEVARSDATRAVPGFTVTLLLALIGATASAQIGKIPPGFTPIFNGRNIDGWHISRTVHHGTTGSYTVDPDGVLVMKAQPFGQGGLLLSDRSYKDFELYLEANPDPHFNSGIFLRSSEGGSAYQIELVPNAWGLYDTLGNVWEWVQDYYNEKIFADPTPPRSGTQHVLKGGGFAADVKNATYLTHAAGPGSKFDVGFRVVKAVE